MYSVCIVLFFFFIALCCSHCIVSCSMYLLLLALFLFSWTSEYSSTALPAALASTFFFFLRGLPADFASYVAPEQFRGGGCAQVLRAVLLSVLEEVSLVGWLRSMAPCWIGGTRLIPIPKRGTGSCCHPQSTMCLQGFWDVAISTAVGIIMQVACTVKKSGHPCFNCFTTFGPSVAALCTAWCGVVKGFSSFLGSCGVLFECLWTKHAGVVTDPLFNTKLSTV